MYQKRNPCKYNHEIEFEMLKENTSSCFQTQHCSSKSIILRCYSQQDDEFPPYTANPKPVDRSDLLNFLKRYQIQKLNAELTFQQKSYEQRQETS